VVNTLVSINEVIFYTGPSYYLDRWLWTGKRYRFYSQPFMSTQPSIHPGWLELRRGAFTCVGWQVTLCDFIQQTTPSSSEVGSREDLYTSLTFIGAIAFATSGDTLLQMAARFPTRPCKSLKVLKFVFSKFKVLKIFEIKVCSWKYVSLNFKVLERIGSFRENWKILMEL